MSGGDFILLLVFVLFVWAYINGVSDQTDGD